ncbi:MAG: IS3 family transposase [Planctomycetota bacterium]|jgi:putative transposase
MRKTLIDRDHPQLSIRRQAALVSVNRNRLRPPASDPDAGDLELCRRIDELHLKRPFFGSRRLALDLTTPGVPVGRGRVRRLMRFMGLRATYPRPRTTIPARDHPKYPYLLRDLAIERPSQVWCSDITYIPMRKGFAYLVVIMDWHSRAILGWRLSNTLDTSFCLDALQDAAKAAGTWPEILNTDQGCQFTSRGWIDLAESNGVRVSMDGRRRWIDDVMVERFWRSLKYEDIYLREYRDLVLLESGVAAWIDFYNHKRRHQGLGYKTPWATWQNQPADQAA